MSAAPQTPPQSAPLTGAQAVVAALLRHGITSGFGIPSIHNIALYEALRQTPAFHHWAVRHEQAAGFAADGFHRLSGRVAAIFASTGPGNLFTVVPLLEALQTQTPILVIGTNIASSLLSRTGGALHETPNQLEALKPLTRFAARVSRPDQIAALFAQAAQTLHGRMPGPAFIEIPHDFFHAPAAPDSIDATAGSGPAAGSAAQEIAQQMAAAQRPVLLLGAGARGARSQILQFAERLQLPVFTTTSGKGLIPADHPLSFGCISRLGSVQELLLESDLLISFAVRLTEFDTGRFRLKLPARHLQIVSDSNYAGDRLPSTLILGDLGTIAEGLAHDLPARSPRCDLAAIKAAESQKLESLAPEARAAYVALQHLRSAMRRDDVLVNDQSILNYWASAFFPVFEPGTFLYPLGSGTLGYGLPAAVGAACAIQQAGQSRRLICIAGDGGFQYTQHELATLAQYGLPVKILLVNDESYGIIAFLQRSMFGQTPEIALKNPAFCRVAEAYGIRAERVTSMDRLRQRLPDWLGAPRPARLGGRTEQKEL